MRLRMKNIRLLALISLFATLTACSSISGNVVPQKGPTMEAVYDSINNTDIEMPLPNKTPGCVAGVSTLRMSNVRADAVYREFHKLPNPELKMYVYPHLAGKEQLPIPGYYTVFNAYTEDHYALSTESTRH